MPESPLALLPSVIQAATQAGRMIAAEFVRPGGPRFSDHVTAPVDHEVELFLRDGLLALLPARFVGEEAGVVAAEPNGYCWVVDPHDGTRAFLEGKRGSAVSIALLRQGRPVLAVVYAPLSPDRGEDLIAWADGGAITRNAAPVSIDLSDRRFEADDVVFLNHGAWQRPIWNGMACAPGRFMPLPSIAYRLARVAVGDGVATQTLRPVNALDIAAGHALLLAAGGVLVAEDGTPVTYSELGESRPSACFGGPGAVVATLRARNWRGSTEARREPRVELPFPRSVPEARLDRGAGCLLGLAIGDALGSLVEFRSAGDIARTYPQGLRDLWSGGPGNTIAGQPTDDTELALALARCLVDQETYDPEAAAAAYGTWFESHPFDAERSAVQAFSAAARAALDKAAAARAAADPASQSSGALARVVPIGLWAGDPACAVRTARQDTELSHSHPVCVNASASLAAGIAAGIAGGDAAAMFQAAAAAAAAGEAAVADTLERARIGIAPRDVDARGNHVLLALHLAFYHLMNGVSAELALIRTVREGGNTATNAAVVGALLGACQGRVAFPPRWTLKVVTCRPDVGLGVQRPRPDLYWPDDLIDLAEALVQRRTHGIS